MLEQIYTNYRLQLPTSEIYGTLVVRDGKIADIQPHSSSLGQDGQGDYLLPGLVELHTDNLEQCLMPRPKVQWPLKAATIAHDRELVGAGITTVCDAIAVGSTDPDSPRNKQFEDLIQAVCEKQKNDRFAADHYLHLRCELGWEMVTDVVQKYAEHPRLKLISLMDHTPGQRQFVNLDRYKQYYQGRYGVSDAEIDQLIQDRLATQSKFSLRNREILVQLGKQYKIPLASHDDATLAHVEESVRDGATIAEFPTTLEAAQSAQSQGLQILMGSPNVMLGGSHSGNVSALELLHHQLVHILSSDYVPQSLLQALFLIPQLTGKPLYESVVLATLNPAKAIGLENDRGSLELGKKADFITVKSDSLDPGKTPRLTAVYRNGHRIA